MSIIKKIIPQHLHIKARAWWHGLRGLFTAFALLLPSTKMKVVGITGTKGKTTVTVFLGRLLNAVGVKTGYISTAVYYLGVGKEQQNVFKMTTIDPVQLQRYLKTMQYVGCKCVILEMSSQGLESNRHLGIFGFDAAVFLNLYPEHIDAHGSMEKYVAAKALLFENLRTNGIAIVNGEFKESETMLEHIPESVIKTGKRVFVNPKKELQTELNQDKYTLSIVENKNRYSTHFFSDVEVLDFYWAARVAQELLPLFGEKKDISDLLKKSSEVGQVPGRMEIAAHSQFADALVDYAHEPESMEQLLKLVRSWKERGLYNNIIHVLSCDGVGRDDWKKEKMGELSAQYADFSYLTTDNYGEEDVPQDIVDLLGKNLDQDKEGKQYFKVLDRYEAMKAAFSRAKLLKGRTLLISTGVGNEYGLTRPGGKIDWSEKERWKSVFTSLGKMRD